MSKRIYRSINEPIVRDGASFNDRWKGEDAGLITCWESGRQKRESNPSLMKHVENGELPVLEWKGGVKKKLKGDIKYGTLYYLAQWQGLRGEDLDIDSSEEKELTCAKTKQKVIYTADRSKWIKEIIS